MFILLFASVVGYDVEGAGSTLTCGLMRDLYEEFGTPGGYNCIGSGSGKTKVFQSETMYAVSEYPLFADEAAQHGVTSLPLIAVEVAIVYNLPKTSRLVMSPSILGAIFTGKVTNWNDSELGILNGNEISLPDEKIKITVRSGGSGTTFMFVDALRRFGSIPAEDVNAVFCDAVGIETCNRLNYTTVAKTSDVVRFVKETPYSIGYVGVKTAIQNNLPFVGIYSNGEVQLPTVESGLATLDGLIPEYSIPTEIPINGYPIEGLAFIIYRENIATPETCQEMIALNNFMRDIYSNQFSSSLYGANWVVPMTASAINLILQRLENWKKTGMAACDVTFDHLIPVWGPLSKSQYYQMQVNAHGRRYPGVRAQIIDQPSSSDPFFKGVEILQMPLKSLLDQTITLNTGEYSHHLFGVRELVFVHHQGPDAHIPVRLSYDVIRSIVNGSISSWDHSYLATHKNAFTGLPTSGKLRFILAEEYVSMSEVISSVLDLPVVSLRYELVTASELNDLVEDPHVITCVDLDRSPSGAGVILPIVDDEERVPFRFRTSDFQILSNGTLTVNHQEAIYPFSYILIHQVPRSIVIDQGAYTKLTGSFMDPCLEYIAGEVIPYLQFSSAFGGISGAPAATNREINTISCNGELLFPPGSTINILVITLPAAGATLLLVVIIVMYFKRMLGKSQGEIKYLIDNNKLAVEIAEAIADMRLEAIAWISELEDPDKLQECFGKIITNLFEYRRYLPDTILYQSDRESRESIRMVEPPEDDSCVTIVFTDVQESTSLWDALSESMAAALRVHHGVIREVIKECDGYEVKTIGDAFMVAFRTPLDAVKFGILAQQRLLVAEWPSSIQNLGICETKCTPQGQKLWSGLRVRIGIHCGAVTSEEDTITGRKDYYGPTVNKASRVEAKSMGGVVMISEEVYKAVFGEIQSMNISVQATGDHELKGITGKHPLHCLAPTELAARLELSTQLRPPVDRKITVSIASSESTKNIPKTKLAAHFKSVTGSVMFAELKHSREVMSPGLLNSVCTAFVDMIDVAADRYDGTIHTHLGNGLLIGFNTGTKQCSNFMQSACKCAAFLASKEPAMGTLRMGLSAGIFASGNVGVRKRTATLSSPHVSIANMLCATANDLGATALFAEMPDCPSIAKTAGVSGVVRPLMKWTIDTTKVAVIHELNCEIFDDWAYSYDPNWGQSSAVASIFEEIWTKREQTNVMDMAGFITAADANPKDLVLGRIARTRPAEYFNMYRLVQAASPELVGGKFSTPVLDAISGAEKSTDKF